jgi:hypothetical protein
MLGRAVATGLLGSFSSQQRALVGRLIDFEITSIWKEVSVEGGIIIVQARLFLDVQGVIFNYEGDFVRERRMSNFAEFLKARGGFTGTELSYRLRADTMSLTPCNYLLQQYKLIQMSYDSL